MAKVKWGVLSTADIGVSKVIPAMQQAEHVDVVAIASRDLERGKSVAASLGIPTTYGSYDDLLAAPDVDAVYIPLPNHLHVEWSIKALEAGKHVLCEKPIGLSAAEAEQLQAAGRQYPNLRLMEAFMYRHHPQWVKTKELVDTGEIGTLKTIGAFFSYDNRDPENIRNKADIGGGGLMDIGCYPISVARFLFDDEPARVAASLEFDPDFGTDAYGSVLMEFGAGTAAFTYSTQLEAHQRVNAVGTEGRIEVMIPFNAPPDRPCVINLTKDGKERTIEFPTTDQYTVQGELMSLAILNDTPVPTPIDDAVANMRVIERCFASARNRSWE
ncbi:MAG: Gfo/Idh/MocA family protein [Spirochaetota bacterium]